MSSGCGELHNGHTCEFDETIPLMSSSLVGQEAQEGNMAKDMFGGRLTPDFVAEKLGHATFQDVRELDMPSCNIRIVDLGAGDLFINLRRWVCELT